MAEHLTYYGYDEDRPVTCPGCGWNGPAKDGSQGLYKELFDVSCPRCDTMLLIVSLPTVEETKEAAARGDARAQADLGYALRVEESREAFERAKLKGPEQLPELEGAELAFVWDHELPGRGPTVITCEEREIWREPARYESWPRFNEVKEILKAKYGGRFRSLMPTPRSTLYLYGDDISAPSKISFD